MSDERKLTAITVFDGEQYDDNWPFSWRARLVDVIAWFQSKLVEIPDEFQDAAICEIDSVSSWEDTHYVHISIRYERPETDDEMQARSRREQEREDSRYQRDMDTLRALKAKYPEAP